MPPSPGQQRQDAANQARAWGVALNIVYGLIGLGIIGYAIDYFAGTLPVWTLVLGGLGLFVGTYRFVREGLEMNRADARRQARNKKSPDGP